MQSWPHFVRRKQSQRWHRKQRLTQNAFSIFGIIKMRFGFEVFYLFYEVNVFLLKTFEISLFIQKSILENQHLNLEVEMYLLFGVNISILTFGVFYFLQFISTSIQFLTHFDCHNFPLIIWCNNLQLFIKKKHFIYVHQKSTTAHILASYFLSQHRYFS